MSVGIQTPEVTNALDRLSPSDINLDSPQLEPSTVVPILSLSPAWIGQEFQGQSQTGTSINGATNTVLDTLAGNWAVITPGPAAFDIAKVRAITIRTKLAGGTVSPVRIRVSWFFPGVAGFDLFEGDVPNPGTLTIGPLLVPQSVSLRVLTAAGGVGDTVTSDICGFQADPGVGLPGVNPLVIITG